MRAFIFLHIFEDCMMGLKVPYLQTTVLISLWITCVYALVDRCTCEIEKPRDVFSFEKSSAIGPLGSDQRPSLFCLNVGEQNVRKDHWPRLKASCMCHRKIFACWSRHQRSVNYCVSADEYPSLIVTSFYLTN